MISAVWEMVIPERLKKRLPSANAMLPLRPEGLATTDAVLTHPGPADFAAD
jgi:hypothetical protein